MQKEKAKTMEVRSTQDGILRAFHLLLQKQSSGRKVKQKHIYEPAGSMVMARHKATRAQKAEMRALVKELQENQGDEQASKGIIKMLSALPVNFVPVKRQIKIDYSKTYPYRSKKR